MKVCLLTFGTLGDVHPFLALAKGLQRSGHDCRIGAPANFAELVGRHGVQFSPFRVDMRALLQSEKIKSIVGSMNPWHLWRGFRDVAIPLFRDILDDCWQTAQDADVILYHPNLIAPPDIAAHIGIPAIAAIYLPMVEPTGAFSFPYFPRVSLGRWLNRFSYSLADRMVFPLIWVRNRWLRERFGTVAGQARPAAILYGYSNHLFPRPADWSDKVHVTGFWFPETLTDWMPPIGLEEFLAVDPKPIYAGFGSMTSRDPRRLAEIAIGAARTVGRRVVIATGWGGMEPGPADSDVFVIESAPHEWLFPRVAAAVHHGGAGTTAACLRAGVPMAICPFFSDQPYWGDLVARLELAPRPILQQRLTVGKLAESLRQCLDDPALVDRVKTMAEKIRSEHGVSNAVAVVEQVVRSWTTHATRSTGSRGE